MRVATPPGTRPRSRVMIVAASVVSLALAACGSSSEPTADDDSTPQAASTPAADESSPSAPASPEGDGYPLLVTDAQGGQFTFDEPVTEIGCRWSGCEQGLADIGVVPAAARLYPGAEGDLVYPHGLPQNIDDLGGNNNPEAWAASGSELILVRAPANPDYGALNEVAPVFYLYGPGYDGSEEKFPWAADPYKENVRLLGQITGQPEAAEEAIARFDAFVDELQELAPEGATETTIAAIWSQDAGNWTLVGGNTPFCRALREYQLGQCVESADRDAATWRINAEAFLALEPDWLAYISGEDGEESDWVNRSDPTWDQISAVRNGQVYNANSSTHCCSLRALAATLHEYAYHVWGEEAGIVDPGNVRDYDYSSYEPGTGWFTEE